ncbi:MAG TPA: metalloregulator ArsR/SmtB family transcription factor [Streptosporangiaceae bacterium]|nr:metalloregulator ArsR/SmtB family transcription factor [Streptosporangiaceae bacterium]
MNEHAQHKAHLFEQMARVAKAMGNGKRLELLDLLAQSERTVHGLAEAAGLGITTASAQLQSLKHGGLVATRRDGTRVYYRLAGDDVADLYARMRAVAGAHLADVAVAAEAFLGVDTEQVTRDELLRSAKEGNVTVLDVRPREEYDAGHIPDAVSIPLDQLADRLAELPDDVEVVAYCRGAYCVLAPLAVRLLTGAGRRARRLDIGMLEWRLAGLPVQERAA